MSAFLATPPASQSLRPDGTGAAHDAPPAGDDEVLFVLMDEEDDRPHAREDAPTAEAPAALPSQAQPADPDAATARADARAARAARAAALVLRGRDLAEVGLVHFEGQDTIERLRARRSLLLYTYIGGCCLCVGMVVLLLFASMGRTVRVLPTAAAVGRIDTADFNEMSITAQAYTLLTFLNTWGPKSIDRAEESLQPFLDPSIRESIAASFVDWRRSTQRDFLHRTIRFVGAEYHGRKVDDVFEILVGYEISESVTKNAEFHRHDAYFAALQFVSTTPTRDNPRGIMLKRVYEIPEKDFDETDRLRWKRWRGPMAGD
jgi:hypothetical protein